MASRKGISPDGGPAVIAHAPCRADLAGGTLDLWPLYLFHPGAVTVNVAIDVLTTCRITPIKGKSIRLHSTDTARTDSFESLEELCRAKSFQHPIGGWLTKYFAPQGGFVLETHSESPAGAGIAGSSALMIATTAALAKYSGRSIGKEEMRVVAQNVEAQIIKVPTGSQDYYPALYGGVSAVHLEVGGIRRESVPAELEDMDSRFVLVYTGVPRQSGINNWEVYKSHIDGDITISRNFEQISQIARAMRSAVAGKDWNDVGRLLRAEWKLRRANYKGISTPFIDNLVGVAMKNGGRAAKVCGAGGGGCVIFMAKDGQKERMSNALRAAGAQLVPFRVARRGLAVAVAKTGERMSSNMTARTAVAAKI